jgi:hypothetical protein
MSFTVEKLNEQNKQELLKTVSGGRRPHAVLVDGGTEKEREQIAYLLAKIYVCENSNGSEPCNNCSSCRKTDEKIHPDIIWVEKDRDRKYYKKDEMRSVVEDAYQTPNEARVRVIIISEMQLVKVDGQNVLLKILEEPPSYTVFILTAESANSVIGTVLSRVSRFRIGENKDDISVSVKTVEVIKNIAGALLSPYEFDMVLATAPLDGSKQKIVDTLTALTVFFRDAIAIKNGGSALVKELEETAEEVAYSIPLATLLKHYESTNDLLKLTLGSPNYALLGAQLCAKLMSDS